MSLMAPQFVAGQIYGEDGFSEGYIAFEDGKIIERGRYLPHEVDKPLAKGIVIPPLVNSHTHLADSVVEGEPQGSLEELVAPPDGLKHRILRETPEEKLIEAMHRSMEDMLSGGVGAFIDFREGGLGGWKMGKRALEDLPLRGTFLARPRGLEYEEEEVEELLAQAQGIAVSALMDWDIDTLAHLAEHVKGRGKIFALHASEAQPENIEDVLDLNPNFLVHMTCATREDLEICADAAVPVVVCPRSSAYFGRLPDFVQFREAHVRVLLGTDNCMFNRPSMLREIAFAYHCARLQGGLSPSMILEWALDGERELLRRKGLIRLQPGDPAEFVVFGLKSRDPSYTLISRAGHSDISLISLGDFLWKGPAANR